MLGRWLAAALLAAVGCARTSETTHIVGSSPSGVPFTFLDVPSQSPRGAMVDVIEAIANDAGFSVEVRLLPFGSLIPALTSGRIHLIAAAMVMTPARREIVDFSDPVYSYGEGLIVPAKDSRDYERLEELQGKVVGAQVGTAYVEPLRSSGLFPEVKVYDSISDILRDVAVGRLGAGFGDYPIVRYQLTQGSDREVRLVESYQPRIVGGVGIGVRKGDAELLGKINRSLRKLKANGSIDRILASWKIQ